MTMQTLIRTLALCLCATVLLGACAETTYRSFDASDDPAPLVERRVQFHLSRAYYRTAPGCAALQFSPADAAPKIRRAVTDAVERHLSTRLPRVMGTGATRRAAARLAVDLSHAGDLRVFARQTRCEAMVRIRLHNVSDDYFVVWSRRGVAISLEMARSRDGRLLWKARHRAGRADGGMPFDVLSLPFSLARAARLKGDKEAFESIADDAVRRMMRTLPDLRGVGRPGDEFRARAAP